MKAVHVINIVVVPSPFNETKAATIAVATTTFSGSPPATLTHL